MKLEKISVRLADDRGLGLLVIKGRTDKGRSLRVRYQFPEDGNLFSPGGDYALSAYVDGLSRRSWTRSSGTPYRPVPRASPSRGSGRRRRSSPGPRSGRRR